MQKRRFRGLAIFLSIALCFTMIPSIGFANSDSGTDEGKTLLVFGASTSTGYGLSSFLNENRGFAVKNNNLNEWTMEAAKENKAKVDAHVPGYTRKGRISEESYPWKLKNYIADSEYDGDLNKVTLSPLAFNGMRTNELHAFLDPEYAQEAFDLENEITGKGNGFFVEHLQSIIDCMGDGGAMVDMEDGKGLVPVWKSGEARDPSSKAYKRAHKYVEDEVKKADVIVIDVCMNNFGTYLALRVGAAFGIPGFENRAKFVDQTAETVIGADPSLVKTANKMKETMQSVIPTLNNESVNTLIDAFIYCYVDCITNLSADIELVNKLKKDDAKVIVVGVYNTLDGITTQLDGKVYDFGEITSKGFQLVNAYIKALDKNSSNYYYADVSSGIETFMNQVVESKSYEEFIADEDNLNVLEKFYQGPDSFYDLFMEGKVDPDNPEVYKKPALVLLYRAAKKVKLDFNELIANLENLYSIGSEIINYFTAALGYQNVPDNYDLTEAQKVTATAYFVDQKLRGVGDNDAMYAAVTAVLKGSYDWKDEDTEKIAKAAAFSGSTAMGADVKDAAEGIGADPENIDSIETCPSDATMQLLQILDRFIVYQGIGQHPSKNGCESMYQDVKVAYDKAMNGGNTAFEDAKEQLVGLITTLLKQTGAAEDVDKIMGTIQKINEVLKIVDEENLTPEQLKEFFELKKDLEAKITKALDYFGLTAEDLMDALGDDENLEKIAKYVEKIQKLNAAIELLESEGFKLELDKDQLDKIIEIKGDLTELVNKVMEQLNLDADGVKNLLKDPKTADKIVEAVNKVVALNEALDMLKENGIDLSKDQLQTLLNIKEDLANLVNNVMTNLGLEAKDIKDILKDPKTADQIVDAVNKIAALNEALDMLKDNGIDLSKDQLQKLLEMKDDLTSLVNDVIDQFGLEADDVKDLLKNPETADKIVEAVGKLIAINEAVELLEKEGLDLSKDQLQKLFALRDEAHARFDEALELLGVSMDDIAKFIDKNTTPEKLAQYARQIEAVKAVLDRLPKSKEELKAELEKKYEVVKKIIGEEGAKRLEAIFNTIKTIDFKNMSEDQIVQILKPIYEIIGELVEAVWYLPEYEQLIDEDILPRLLEVETENAELRAQANDLQNQVTKLKAKSIFAMPKASLAIANKKATVNVSWEKDEDAAGYVFKVNGKETTFKEGNTAMTYSANAVIGKAYTFEVTPYIEDGAKKISGKTFKITFVPKVKVGKAKIKRVKKNAKSFKVKWKKVKNADGYQVYYKAAGKKAKKKLVKSGNKTALKIKKAKKVKKYRVNVRAYRIVNGKKYFGAWSNTKNVKYK